MSTYRVGVVGAGVIGAGIARLFSGRGATTTVVAPRPGGVERATERIQRYYASDIKHGRLSVAEAEAGLGNIVITPRYSDLHAAAFVIESVIEDLRTKHEVLAAVEACVPPECIIASNTSSIPIAMIAAPARRPDRVIGTHYFWPAHRYRLIEVAAADVTSEQTRHRTLALARWQGKVPLLVRDRPGFFTTRILLVYLSEAIGLVTEGASIDAVDSAMKAFGWAMGPFQLMDAVGLDVFPGIYHSVCHDLGARISHLRRLWKLLDAGHVGHKGDRRGGAKGFYLDPDGQVVDTRAHALIGRNANGAPSATELATRPIYQMINEIGSCLAEGVVSSPDDADLGAFLGLGWPQQQGGPLAYARRVGLDRILDQLASWTRQYDPRFAPSQFLIDSATVLTDRSRLAYAGLEALSGALSQPSPEES